MSIRAEDDVTNTSIAVIPFPPDFNCSFFIQVDKNILNNKLNQ
jgi:hypothetical protein